MELEEVKEGEEYQPPVYGGKQPAYAPKPVNADDDEPMVIAVRFVTLSEKTCFQETCSCCIACCCKCCMPQEVLPQQYIVDDSLTVGQFMEKVNSENDCKQPFIYAELNGFKLRDDDLLAPSIRAFQYFAMPVMQLYAPADGCCNLI